MIAIINGSSKLIEKGKTIKRHTMPNIASFGIVDKKARIEVSVPLYTSIIQFANGKTDNLEINPSKINIQANEYIREGSPSINVSYMEEKFKDDVIPYKYETPNKNTAVETAFVIRYLKEASLEEYPFTDAIKKYVGNDINSTETSNVIKSLDETIFSAPKMAVNSSA